MPCQRLTPVPQSAPQSDASARPAARGRGTARSAEHQHHPHAVDGRGAAGEVRASRHADGAGPARLHAVEPRACASIRPIRSGPTAIASCSRTVTPRCCCGRVLHLTRHAGGEQPSTSGWASRPSRSTTSSASVSSTARRLVTLSTAGSRASRPRRVRSARACATSVGMAIAGAWLAARYNRPGFPDLRLRHLRRVRRRLHDGRRRRRRPRRWRAISASTTSAGSTTTTTSRSKATRDSRSRRTWRRASWPTAGTCCASATPTTSSASSRRSRSSKATRGAADVHHPRQPHRLRRAAQAGHGRGPWRAAGRGRDPRSRSATMAGPKTPSSWSPTACTSTSRRASVNAARRPGARGSQMFEAYRTQHPDLATEVDADAAARTAGRVGPRTCRSSPPMRRDSRDAMRRARC